VHAALHHFAAIAIAIAIAIAAKHRVMPYRYLDGQ